MIRIIIKTIPKNKLFDPMPLPKKRREVSVAGPRLISNTAPFVRKVSKIAQVA